MSTSYSWEGKGKVWLVPIADERVGVQVKLRNPLRTHAISERFCSGDSLRRGAISSVYTFTFCSAYIIDTFRRHLFLLWGRVEMEQCSWGCYGMGLGLPGRHAENRTLLTYFQDPCGSQKLRVWICIHMYISLYLCPVRAEIFNRTSCPKTRQSGSKPDTWQP